MPKPPLEEPFASLANEMIETGLAGHKEWRPDLAYPESHSDMQAFVRGILRRFDVKRRALDIDLPIEYDVCATCGEKITDGSCYAFGFRGQVKFHSNEKCFTIEQRRAFGWRVNV